MLQKINILKVVLLTVVVPTLLSLSYGQGTISCFLNIYVPSVRHDLSCADPQQPPSRKIDYKRSVNINEPTTNPCDANETPFEDDANGRCMQLTPGVDHFQATLP